MKRVMLIAYHYPPMCGSSGIQRTYRFAQYLKDYGWEPIVLSVATRAYQALGNACEDLEGVPVCRAFALDSAKHLSILGRYPGWLARPDRWITWWLGGTVSGWSMIRHFRPDVLWSTYPIPTAHLVGHSLAKISGLPWVADFRDPMAHEGYPENEKTWASFLKVERKVFTTAAAATFTTRGALNLYKKRYADSSTDFHLIENGFDEDAFSQAELRLRLNATTGSARIVLLHSGIVYPQWRNPRMLFRAIRKLADQDGSTVGNLLVRFRAPVHDEFVVQLAREENVMDFVEIAPELNYIEALAEMMTVQGLLLLQNEGCNDQVPAKLYEYLRAGRPILGLTDPDGDTATSLRAYQGHYLADLSSAVDIEKNLVSWLRDDQPGAARPAMSEAIQSCSRKGRTRQLADVLNSVIH